MLSKQSNLSWSNPNMNNQPIVLRPGKQANGHAEFYRLPESFQEG